MTASAQSVPTATKVPPRPGPLLLVVEDSPDDWFLFDRALRKSGLNATAQWVKQGMEAQSFLQEAIRAGSDLPVCIISDLKMPIMDGFEFLRFIRSDPVL